MIRNAVLLSLLSLSLFGQVNHYVSTYSVTLAAATTAATLQQPATNAKQVTMEWAEVYCSVACTVTQSVNCTTGATATAGTPVALPGSGGVKAVATFWTASNVSGCTTLKTNVLPAGATASFTFDTTTKLPTGGVTSNYTFSVSSITGDVIITIGHQEQ